MRAGRCCAKAAFWSSQLRGCLQTFLQGGNSQDYACLLVSLVAKDRSQCGQDSPHCEQCAYWALLWCLAKETDFANEQEEEVVVVFLHVLFFKQSFFLYARHFYFAVFLLVASASFCCLLDTHQICNDFQNQSLAFLRFHSNKLHQWEKEKAKLYKKCFRQWQVSLWDGNYFLCRFPSLANGKSVFRLSLT